MLGSICKPWYLARPHQLLARMAVKRYSPGLQPLKTSWGGVGQADPKKAIGSSIAATGLFDLPVTESLVRLTSPGALVIDAGANIGYMTQLASFAVGQFGRVLAFEPHPEWFAILRTNAGRCFGRGCSPEIRQAALGATPGTLLMEFPGEGDFNEGVGHVVEDASVGAVTVTATTIDAELGDARADVLKVDVEGHEFAVLQGAARALSERRIQNIIFEAHDVQGSPLVPYLQEWGYSLHALGWTLRGPCIAPLEAGRLARDYEAPSYLATLDAERVYATYSQRGWRSLRSLISMM